MSAKDAEILIEQTSTLLEDARVAFNDNDFVEAERVVRAALDILLSVHERSDVGVLSDSSSPIYAVHANIAHAYNRMNTIYDAQGDFHKAIEYAMTAIEYCQKIGLQWRIGNLYGNIGGCYANLGDFSLSLEYLNKALAYAEEICDVKLIATWLTSIAAVYGYIGDVPSALEIYTRIQKIAHDLADDALLANCELSIGQIYLSIEKHELALEYMFRALASFKVFANAKQDVAIALTNIGIVQEKMGDYEPALRNLKEALSINEDIHSKAYAANCTGNIGDVYTRMGDYDQAIVYLTKALHQAEEIDDKRQQAHWTLGLGVALSNHDRAEVSKGEQYIRTAIEQAGELGLIELEARCHRSLSDLLASHGRWEESAAEFRTFYEFERRVQNEESLKQTRQLENQRKVDEAERDRQIKLARFQEQEKILHNILPSHIADRMVAGEKMIAESHENVSVFFSDIVEFTKLSQKISAEEVVGMLNELFTQFDQVARKHGLEKIKTIGDAYMAVAGAPVYQEDHVQRSTLFALEVTQIVNNYRTESGEKIALRIGLHCGSVVAGVIGENKYAYDVWGDAVNTANRMESRGEPGKIHVSEQFLRSLMDSADSDMTLMFESGTETRIDSPAMDIPELLVVPRGEVDIKGKGMMRTYFLERSHT